MENKTDRWEGLVTGGQGKSADDVAFSGIVAGIGFVLIIGIPIIILVYRALFTSLP